MTLPEYINCNRKGEIVHCEYLLTEDCPNTCAYAVDVGGIGVGAIVRTIESLVRNEFVDEYGNKKNFNNKPNPSYQSDEKE